MSECSGATGAHPVRFSFPLEDVEVWENFMSQIFILGRAIFLILAYKI